MKIIKKIDISVTPRNEGFPSVAYNSVDKEFLVVWGTAGKLRACNNRFDPECGNWLSIDVRRVSPDGELLSDVIQIDPLEECGQKTLPRAAYNSLRNEYMVTYQYAAADSSDADAYIVKTDNHGNVKFQPKCAYENVKNISHPLIVFNSLEQRYLLAFNDRRLSSFASTNPVHRRQNIINYFINDIDNLGCILDEDGMKLEAKAFVIGNPRGTQFNNQCVYNSQDNTFFVIWEDFRHVRDIYSNCDIYGALLDSSGNMIREEFPVMDDFGTPDEGSQNNQSLAYNPDQNEYLVAWGASNQPSLAALDGGVVGMILHGDGTPKGGTFVIADAQFPQNSPTMIYSAIQKKYFVVWSDSRNDTALRPGVPFYFGNNIDVYGRWVNPDGTMASDEILLADGEDFQAWPNVAYDPASDKLIIVWWDRNAPNDYEPPPSSGMGMVMKGDVRGVIYGTP
jgi:hypothetical protein